MVLERARPVARLRPAPQKPPILPPSLAPPETGSLDDAGPLYLSLSSLFSQIGARLRQTEAPYDRETIRDVLALLGRAELNPVEWEQFSEQRSDRYTRNVVAVDERFVAPPAKRDGVSGSSERPVPGVFASSSAFLARAGDDGHEPADAGDDAAAAGGA